MTEQEAVKHWHETMTPARRRFTILLGDTIRSASLTTEEKRDIIRNQEVDAKAYALHGKKCEENLKKNGMTGSPDEPGPRRRIPTLSEFLDDIEKAADAMPKPGKFGKVESIKGEEGGVDPNEKQTLPPIADDLSIEGALYAARLEGGRTQHIVESLAASLRRTVSKRLVALDGGTSTDVPSYVSMLASLFGVEDAVDADRARRKAESEKWYEEYMAKKKAEGGHDLPNLNMQPPPTTQDLVDNANARELLSDDEPAFDPFGNTQSPDPVAAKVREAASEL